MPDRSRRLVTRAGFFSPSLDGGLPLFELFNPSRRSSSASRAFSDAFSACRAATSARRSSIDGARGGNSQVIRCLNRNPSPPSREFFRRTPLSPNLGSYKFAEKVVDIVGLYLNPPDKAVVLCVDEKSQIQALDRTQPGLPMKKGRAQTMTHDYKRNGTTTLFAALDVKTGEVIGECLPRHRAKEFIRFLKKINRAVAKHLDVHAICDNYKTHKTKEVQAWLAKHPRFKLHFTPTSSSWINLVERLFAEITRQQIRRGVFKSVAELEAAIETWLTERNAKPKPFKWTAKANIILEKNARAKRALEEDLAAGTK